MSELTKGYAVFGFGGLLDGLNSILTGSIATHLNLIVYGFETEAKAGAWIRANSDTNNYEYLTALPYFYKEKG